MRPSKLRSNDESGKRSIQTCQKLLPPSPARPTEIERAEQLAHFISSNDDGEGVGCARTDGRTDRRPPPDHVRAQSSGRRAMIQLIFPEWPRDGRSARSGGDYYRAFPLRDMNTSPSMEAIELHMSAFHLRQSINGKLENYKMVVEKLLLLVSVIIRQQQVGCYGTVAVLLPHSSAEYPNLMSTKPFPRPYVTHPVHACMETK